VPFGELLVDWSSGDVAVVGVSLPRELSPFNVLAEGDLTLRARLSARTRLLELLRGLVVDGDRRVSDQVQVDPALEHALADVVGGLRETRSDVVSDGAVLWRGGASLAPVHQWWAARADAQPSVPGPARERPGLGPAAFRFVVVRASGLEPPLALALGPTVRTAEGGVLLRPEGSVKYCRASSTPAPKLADGGLYVRPIGTAGRTGCDVRVGPADAEVLRATFPEGRAPLLIELPPAPDERLPF